MAARATRSFNDNFVPMAMDGTNQSSLQDTSECCCRPPSNWSEYLMTSLSASLAVGVTMLIIGFLVPRTPPYNARIELTAREYEALALAYAKRGFLLDVVMVIGLGCILIGAIILSTLHVYTYCKNEGSVRMTRSFGDEGDSIPLETIARRTHSYGGLAETER